MTRSITTRSPISELWKRRMVFFSIGCTIVTLIGIVMMAVECTKLETNIFQAVMLGGCFLYSVGVLFIYFILWFSVLWKGEYPTSPVVISSSVLHSLTGSSLICVAYLLPADSMFDFAFPQVDDRWVDSTATSSVPKDHDSKSNDSLSKDIVSLVQLRLTMLGGIIAGCGFVGGTFSMIIIFRVYKNLKIRKDAEMERRKKSRRHWNPSENNTLSKAVGQRRGSVYDYAGWANRTKDIFQDDKDEKARDGAFSRSHSTMSSSAITGSGFDLRSDKHTAIDGRNMVTSFSMASTVIRNDDMIIDTKPFNINPKAVNWAQQKHKSSASMDIGQHLRGKKQFRTSYPESYSMDEIYKGKTIAPNDEPGVDKIEDENV